VRPRLAYARMAGAFAGTGWRVMPILPEPAGRAIIPQE
jgi:hypothetical protein